MDQTVFTKYDQLPLVLRAGDIAAVLGISRANAYALIHRQDFPTLRIGTRLLVPKSRFLEWIEFNSR